MPDTERNWILKGRALMKGRSVHKEAPPVPQREGVPQPPLFMARGSEAGLSLPRDFGGLAIEDSLLSAMKGRRTRRDYSEESLSLTELAFLLWMTQGVQETVTRSSRCTLRPVPSAGARHALESYLLVNRVSGLEPGIWHYLAETHRLERLPAPEGWEDLAAEALMGQTFASGAPAVFLWTALPERMEWRYTDQAHKYILLDAGHVCQNLFLAAEALGLGVCPLGAYLQEPADRLLGLEGKASGEAGEEFVVYGACVGRRRAAG